jgi:hypothetical protein
MGKIRYRIIPQPNLTFTVEIFGTGNSIYGAAGFTNVADAEAWINEKKRAAKADEMWERSSESVRINGRLRT